MVPGAVRPYIGMPVLIGAFLLALGESVQPGPMQESAAQVVVYLETDSAARSNVSLELLSLDLIGRAGEAALHPRAITVNSTADAGTSRLIAEEEVPAGDYQFLRCIVRLSGSDDDDSGIVLEAMPESVVVAYAGRLEAGTTVPIFLIWEPLVSRVNNAFDRIKMALVQPDIPPEGSLAFVSNEGSDNVTVVDRLSKKVIDVFRTGGGPRGMAYSPMTRNLYVAAADDNSLTVYDMTARQVVQTVPLRFGDEPSRICLSPDGLFLYIVNEGSNSLAVFNTGSFQEVDRQSLGNEPAAISVDDFRGSVFISNRLSEHITVYGINAGSEMREFSVAGLPSEILFDSHSQSLFVSLDGQRVMLVLDAQTGRQTATVNLCSAATGLAYNPGSEYLYVAQGDCMNVAVLKPDKELTLGRIPLPGRPGLITLDPENRWLLAVMPESDGLAMINVNSRKVAVILDVGHRPYMAVVTK